MTTAAAPLLAAPELARLRLALDGYTVAAIHELLGWTGRSALARGDLAGVARQVRTSDAGPLATLVELFLLGAPVGEGAARAALGPLPLEAAAAAGLLETSVGSVRALLDVRPYAEDTPARPDDPAGDAPDWWVVSDFGSDVRPGPLAADHVLGIGAASLTLAQATPRVAAHRALDLGTGCGVQALHLGRHVRDITATDISPRALRLAATTAALSGQSWELREGSLLEPVENERFDLVVANPPFVVSAGTGGYDYRDSGLAGDDVCRALVTGIPGRLAAEGTGQLLANWIVPADGSWQERLAGWLDGSGCDAWVWQREIAEVGEYVALWLRDAGESPGTDRWRARYDDWLDWFAAQGIAAVGMGLITLWRTDSAEPVVVLEDIPQAVEQPAGAHLAEWIGRRRALAATSSAGLLGAMLHPADDLVRSRDDLLTPDADGPGWRTAASRLRQSHGMRWEVEVDDAVAGLVASCDGRTPLVVALSVLAAALASTVDEVWIALEPVVRDLVGRGFLLLPAPRP